MYLLDTDILFLHFREPQNYPRLELRLRSIPPDQRYLSAVTLEELYGGALAFVHKHRSSSKAVEAFNFFVRLHEFLKPFPVVPYDAVTHARFLAFPPEVKRLGTQDCRIAACALVHDFAVLTRNGRHFSQIPDVKWEDWTG